MDDLIRRQQAIDIASGYCHPANIAEELRKLPPAQSKVGKWIPVTNGRGGHECDKCHNYAPAWQTGEERLTNFCPNCGADMRGEQDE